MIHKKSDFEESLKENLLLYVCDPDVQGRDLFQVHREISIARYALSQQAQAYAKAMEFLTNLLEKAIEQSEKPGIDHAKIVSNIMVAIGTIESKSALLINSVKTVTELLGAAINIDVDKAHLRSMVVALPSLVKESISSLTQDEQLASKVYNNLNNRITEMMIALRFQDGETTTFGIEDQRGITLDQYNEMINSVPTAQYN